jgi:hypothetical protein
MSPRVKPSAFEFCAQDFHQNNKHLDAFTSVCLFSNGKTDRNVTVDDTVWSWGLG